MENDRVCVVELVRCQADLFQIVFAMYTTCRFPCGLYGWQEQRDQDTDRGNHHERFDERETAGSTMTY